MLFLIDLKGLRICLENYIILSSKTYLNRETVKDRITIKRKKKMIIEQTPNGDTKLKRRNVIKIEIIE